MIKTPLCHRQGHHHHPSSPYQILLGVGFLGAGLIVKSSEVDPDTGERHHLVQGITTAAATWLSAAGKSAFELFYLMNSHVQYAVLVIWLLHLNLVCLYLIAFANHMY